MTRADTPAALPRVLGRFRRTFLLLNSSLVAVAAATCGVLHGLHWHETSILETVLCATAVFVVMPGLVHLLYRSFRKALARALEEQEHALQEARRREEELNQVVHSLIDPMLAVDEQGMITRVNPAVRRVFGWAPEEILGGNVSLLMGEPYRSEHDDYIRRYLETGERRAIGRVRKVLGRRKNGEEFPCELSVSEVRAPGGKRYFVGVVRDVSEREEMAARLTQAERLAAVGELAAGIAHEINNPINTILNCAQLIQDGDEDPRLVEDIKHESMRIAGIVRDLLDFARDRREQHSPTHLQEVVRRTLSLVQRRIEKHGIQLETDVPGDLPQVKARSQQLQQVLLNLLLNARDALAEDPREHEKRIILRVDQTQRDGVSVLRVRVRDNGPGIRPEHRDRIFQPFFTTKRERGGNGLGLAVSLGIMRDHHGSLTVDSVPGEYCEFVMELPVDNGWQESADG